MEDALFAVPDVLDTRDETALFKAPLGKDLLADELDLFDFDPAWLDKLDGSVDRDFSDNMSMVPDHKPSDALPVPQQLPPARESVAQEVARVPDVVFMPPAPVVHIQQQCHRAAGLDVPDVTTDIDMYIPRSLLPMDPGRRAQLLAERREKVQRFREKKKNRQFTKTIRYASRKAYAEVRPRIKGRFARKDEVAAMRAAGLLPVA